MYIQLNNLASIMEGFSKQQVYYDTLKEEFFQSDNYEYQNSTRYIAVTNFDDSKIINMYVEQLKDKELQHKILSLLSDAKFIGKFHRLINNEGVYADFIKFSEEIKLGIAKEWCIKNNIKYTLKK